MNSERILRFKHRLLPFVGLIFLLLGLMILPWLTSAKTLNCERGTGECRFSESSIFSEHSVVIPLATVQEAVVDRRASSSDSGGYVYRTLLVTDEDRHQLTVGSSSPRGPHDRLAAQVNHFLSDTSESELSVRRTMGWWGLFFLAFPLGGLFLMFGVRNISEAELDVVNGQLHLRKRRWWQSTALGRTLDVEEIEDVDLENRQSKNGQTRRTVLRMRDGEVIPLFGIATNGKGPVRRRDQLISLLQQSPQFQGPKHGSHHQER
ncbi:hypothetical protein J2T60_000192 [Natronospira proteinivora]|uniref:PH (Pleckstrin Homology) domain-containing protein n=1 Tax=Natronospira proteinivora TaxID=1807133 RepID=A0ABT1G4K6_9GAMM|nr:hypothetical protein [Natronospira proteinivora]MCP1726227.1 hypothetical protein [Natronospira proteinivora]